MRWSDYKGSAQWYRLKDIAMQRAGHRCQHGEECEQQQCPNRTHLEMHHDFYPSCPENDRSENVRILCRDCHQDFHDYNDLSDEERATKLAEALEFLSKYSEVLDWAT